MSTDYAIYLSKQLLWQALVISSPIIIVALVCGLIISILQVLTQIQDSTLSFAPKVLAVAFMLMLSSNWMLNSIIEFSQTLFTNIPKVIKS